MLSIVGPEFESDTGDVGSDESPSPLFVLENTTILKPGVTDLWKPNLHAGIDFTLKVANKAGFKGGVILLPTNGQTQDGILRLTVDEKKSIVGVIPAWHWNTTRNFFSPEGWRRLRNPEIGNEEAFPQDNLILGYRDDVWIRWNALREVVGPTALVIRPGPYEIHSGFTNLGWEVNPRDEIGNQADSNFFINIRELHHGTKLIVDTYHLNRFKDINFNEDKAVELFEKLLDMFGDRIALIQLHPSTKEAVGTLMTSSLPSYIIRVLEILKKSGRNIPISFEYGPIPILNATTNMAAMFPARLRRLVENELK